MTTSAELELAITHLLRAREMAVFYGRPKEVIDRIDVIFRAAKRVKAEITGKAHYLNQNKLKNSALTSP